MEKEEIARKLKSYPMGIIVRLNWNRLNGDLERNYIYLGNNIFDGIPMMMDCESFENNRATFFDFPNPDIFIKDISITTYGALKGLINLQ